MGSNCSSKSCPPPIPATFKTRTVVEALKAARELIRPYDRWVTGYLAVDGNGRDLETSVKSPEAEAFCALGALRRVNGKFQKDATKFLALAIEMAQNPSSESFPIFIAETITNNNDRGGRKPENHQKVLGYFDKAIGLAIFWKDAIL